MKFVNLNLNLKLLIDKNSIIKSRKIYILKKVLSQKKYPVERLPTPHSFR